VKIQEALHGGYHSALPKAIRGPLWHLKASFGEHDPRKERIHRREFRTAVGWPAANIEVDGIKMRVDLRDQGVGHQRYEDRDSEPAETRFVPGQTAGNFDADYINLVFADSAG
jgi:hypothetical protein